MMFYNPETVQYLSLVVIGGYASADVLIILDEVLSKVFPRRKEMTKQEFKDEAKKIAVQKSKELSISCVIVLIVGNILRSIILTLY